MEENGSKGLSVAALIFGILGILCCCIGFPFAIIGLILAIIALAKHKAGKGLAIAGLITSLITLIISAYMAISVLPYTDEIVDYTQNIETYVEQYQEDGSFPPLYEKFISEGKMTEEQAQQFMDMVVSSAGQAAQAG